MSGSQIFFECLKNEKVKTIFGYPGGAVLPFYDTLYDIKEIEHILVRHEQGAVHMAEGYTRATGKTGVVLVTSGPGATNTVTGITDAFMDSVPIVIFTGQVPKPFLGLDSFQEADVIGITRPITKWNKLVRSPQELLEAIPKAFEIANSGRPGPVLIDIPKDVALEEFDFQGFPARTPKAFESKKIQIKNQSDIFEKVLKALEKAKKPLLYFGGGVIQSQACSELKEFVELTNIPFTSTLQGLGGLPGDHPNSLGMLGMHGTYSSNMAIDHCDLLIVLGARFDDRVTGKTSLFSKNSYKIHFDIDPSNMDKTIHCDLNVIGDLKNNLLKILPSLKKNKSLKNLNENQNQWWSTLSDWKQECPLKINKKELGATLILSELNSILKKNKTKFSIATDVGQNQMWASQYIQFQSPKTHITSGGLGTMGFSVPAAIGAAFGKKEQLNKSEKEEIVISISGDGGFQMNMQELITATTYKAPVKFIILNNSYLGMIRQWQELFHKERFSFTSLEGANPDFCLLAKSMGIPSKRLDDLKDVENSINWVLEPGTRLLECIIPQEEMVFPIIPSNSSIKDMITERFSKEEK
ncbi:MAG: acetolactate synthase, large subunit, biosynthetic type [Halobacteriovoraceae bacterium]|nr:acetolactate synthase, large subunit, biosynthetic type [Halobacteriovoraceae bacterium]